MNPRRGMAILRTGLFVAGVLAAAVSGAVLASNAPARLDATSGGGHRLSGRTAALVNSLGVQVRVIAALDRSKRDQRLTDAVADVIAAAGAASPAVRVTTIDLATPAGRSRYADLIASLLDRERGAIDAVAAAIADAANEARSISAVAQGLSDRLNDEAGATVDARAAAALRETAAAAANAARALADAADLANASDPNNAADSNNTPPEPQPGDSIGVDDPRPRIDRLANTLAGVGAALGRVADSAERAGRREAARAARGAMDRASLSADRLRRLEMPAVVRIAPVLRAGEALLVLGPGGEGRPTVAAIDTASIIPARPASTAAGVTLARRETESALFAAIASVTRSDRPIVVLAHAQWGSMARVTGLLRRRLEASGIDLVDWPAARGDPHPPIDPIDPSRSRPVVYVVFPADTWAQPQTLPDGSELPRGSERNRLMAQVLERLMAEGRPVLVATQPSVLSSVGDPDPYVSVLATLGVEADAGRALMSAAPTPAGPQASPLIRQTPGPGLAHPIAAAVRGLPLRLDWGVGLGPLDLQTTAAALTIEPADDRWAETRWLAMVNTPPRRWPQIDPQPRHDPDQGDGRGPWTVVMAVDRPHPQAGRHRAVVAGGSTWLLDPVWARVQTLAGSGADGPEGASILESPGNIELFEAAVAWLAGQDELIAPSPTARSVALVGPLSPGLLSGLRWGLIAGLPLGLLAIGAVVIRLGV